MLAVTLKPKRAIIQIDAHGNTVGEFESIRLAAEHFNVAHCTLVNCLAKRAKTCAGYYWKYKTPFRGKRVFEGQPAKDKRPMEERPAMVETRGRKEKPLDDNERIVFEDVIKNYICPADIQKKYGLTSVVAHRIYDLGLKEITHRYKLSKQLFKIELSQEENELAEY